MEFVRSQSAVLARRLREARRFIQAVTGPRQVGKTTLVQQVVAGHKLRARFASADEPTLRGAGWIEQQWEAARIEAVDAGKSGSILILDEIQKIPRWSETVKRLWDEDTHSKVALRVVLLGSAPMLISQGLTESLAGRFELLHLPHWSYTEMKSAFRWSLEQYIFFGGYPGAAPLIRDEQRWRRYILDSLIETTIARDVLLQTRVDKPAMLRRLFELGCRYSGQELSYTKMLGQLQDAGNSTTLAHYLDLLAGVGMVQGLQKFAGETVRQRGSSPKLQVFNTALMSAQSDRTFGQAKADREYWGHLVESAIGAHLANAAVAGEARVFYWRDRNFEVDFIVQYGQVLTAIEVKSGRASAARSGLESFSEAFRPQRKLLVGADGISIESFLSKPVEYWTRKLPVTKSPT
jgi:predicted AAA+ superfamily ATPase